MIWPPSVLRLRIHNRDRRLGLWLPLFIIWPPIVLLALAIFPLVIVIAVLLWPIGRGKRVLLAGPLLFSVFCSLRGLEIDVAGPGEQVFIAFR